MWQLKCEIQAVADHFSVSDIPSNLFTQNVHEFCYQQNMQLVHKKPSLAFLNLNH